MFGPALTRLLKDLGGRKDKQTDYERLLYAELLALQIVVGAPVASDMIPMPAYLDQTDGSVYLHMSVGRPPDDAAAILRADFSKLPAGLVRLGALGNLAYGLPRIQASPDTMNLEITVGPKDDDPPPRMQLNCDEPECPNKKFGNQ